MSVLSVLTFLLSFAIAIDIIYEYIAMYEGIDITGWQKINDANNVQHV